MAKLLYQGHGSLRLTTEKGTVVYLDPYAGEGYDLPADGILVTHNHFDHNRVELPAKKAGCRVITPSDALRDGVYRAFTVGDIAIQAFPAENQNHPRKECVGYLVEADGKRFYFSGDTSGIPEMDGLRARHLDYAFLPTDGIYNMGAEEAADCAARIGALHTVPIHMNPKKLFDARVASRFQAAGRLILRPGEEISC